MILIVQPAWRASKSRIRWGEFGGEFDGQAGRYHSFYWGHLARVGE